MNETPKSERIHIGIFGRRNAGKSSLINAITGQDLAVVSPIKGTTTDPVAKAMELAPIGAVVLIDTPGIDDVGELGELRVKRTQEVLRKSDLALLVVDVNMGFSEHEEEMLRLFEEKEVPFLIVMNKVDLSSDSSDEANKPISQDINQGYTITAKSTQHHGENANDSAKCTTTYVSAHSGHNIYTLKEQIAVLYTASLAAKKAQTTKLVSDLVSPGDMVVLVVPIDKAAPKGRLILPQQQVIRDLIDVGAIPIITRDHEYLKTLQELNNPPALVITDSQVFAYVSKHTPSAIRLTSFSILMARYKGVLHSAMAGARILDHLKDGDRILIAEGCTHHRQCEDIGTVKLPNWIRQYTKCEPQFDFCAGNDFPEDLSGYKVIIHCGACMLNEKEMRHRKTAAAHANIPMTNYGIAISHMQGILERTAKWLPFD